MLKKAVIIGLSIASFCGNVATAQFLDLTQIAQQQREGQPGNQPQSRQQIPETKTPQNFPTPREDPYANYPSLRGCGHGWGFPADCERAKQKIDDDCSAGRYCARQQ